MEDSQMKRKLNRNTINLAKLSLVLKNKSSMNVSPGLSVDNSDRKKHALSRFQQDEINSIANILNETLSKLKKPNTHVLTPLEQPVISKAQSTEVSAPAAPADYTTPKNRNLSLLSIVGGLGQSVGGADMPTQSDQKSPNGS